MKSENYAKQCEHKEHERTNNGWKRSVKQRMSWVDYKESLRSCRMEEKLSGGFHLQGSQIKYQLCDRCDCYVEVQALVRKEWDPDTVGENSKLRIELGSTGVLPNSQRKGKPYTQATQDGSQQALTKTLSAPVPQRCMQVVSSHAPPAIARKHHEFCHDFPDVKDGIFSV
ncbi:hypothetical protein STEG23_017746 [Scotinomys teguina]